MKYLRLLIYLVLSVHAKPLSASNTANCIIIYENYVPEGVYYMNYNKIVAKLISEKVEQFLPALSNTNFVFINNFKENGNVHVPVYISKRPFKYTSKSDFINNILNGWDENIEQTEDDVSIIPSVLPYLNKKLLPADSTYIIFFTSSGSYDLDNDYFNCIPIKSSVSTIRYYDNEINDFLSEDLQIDLYKLLPAEDILDISNSIFYYDRQTTKENKIKLISNSDDKKALDIVIKDNSISLDPVLYSIELIDNYTLFTTVWPLQWCIQPLIDDCYNLPKQGLIKDGSEIDVSELIEPYIFLNPLNNDSIYEMQTGIFKIKAKYINGVYDQLYYEDTCHFYVQIARPDVVNYSIRGDIVLTNQELIRYSSGREMSQTDIVEGLTGNRKKSILIIICIITVCLLITIGFYYRKRINLLSSVKIKKGFKN